MSPKKNRAPDKTQSTPIDDEPAHVDHRSGGIYIDRGKLHVQGNVAGRDLIVVNLPPLTWAIPIAIIVPALIVAAALLLPSLIGEGPMTGLFNIAVADFGIVDEHRQVVASADGASLSQAIFGRIRDEFKATPALTGIVQVRHVRMVQGASATEQEKSANQLLQDTKANVLIYGNLTRPGTGQTLVPQFYVRELKNAEEIVGANQLGKPVSIPSSSSLGNALILSDALKARTQALTFFTLGLAYLTAKDTTSAIAQFEQAANQSGWKDDEGKEIVYLFLGSAYSGSKNPSDWTRAREAFDKALALSPGYSRPHIGLGNLYYMQFTRSDSKDWATLDMAMTEYEKARDATIKPTTAYVDIKVHISLGNIYMLKAQLISPDWFTKAQTEYLPVVNAYEQGEKDLKPLVGQVYFSLGIIQERTTQDWARAADMYRKASAASETKDLQQAADTQLKIVQAKMGTPAK